VGEFGAKTKMISVGDARMALPSGMPTLVEINRLTEKWVSFLSMIFQGFLEKFPT
jgi:hypothetical protein